MRFQALFRSNPVILSIFETKRRNLMKHFIISIILIFFTSGFSQEILKVKSIKTLITPTETAGLLMGPKWAPDGRKIAFTSLNYRGIWIYRVQTGKIEQVTDEMAAGFGFSWSSNSQYILTRVSRFENNRRLSAMKTFDIDQGKELYLTEYRKRLPDIPRWSPANNQVIFYNGKQMEYLDVSPQPPAGPSPFICYPLGDKIYFENTISGEKREFQPFLDAVYLNVILAPDDAHVAFEVYGGNCYLLNLKTSELTDLGRGNYPGWSPDGRYVVYMVAQDDGHRYTTSDIYISDTSGKLTQNLTSEIDQIAMYPSWSPRENKIAFSTYDLGTIEVIDFVQ